jgi:hypothetical protein
VVLAGGGLPRNVHGAAESSRAPAGSSNEITVALKDIPVWEVTNQRVRASFLRGQYAFVRPLQKGMDLPGKRPEFTSDAPLYGEVSFPGAAADSRKSGRHIFALDCSRKGGDYDLLYFDDNGDEDLTNDKVRKPSPESDRLARRSSSLQETYFEPVKVVLDLGPGGRQSLELLPCLRAYQGSSRQFGFIAARVHTGEFEVAGTSYQAFLGYQYMIQGPLDRPSTALILVPQGGEPAYWWGGDQLDATHLLGGRYYRFSCTPTGDKLSVRPYEGPLGVFEVGAGGRNVQKMDIQGSLRSQETSVAIGEGLVGGWPKATRQCRIPVGDYYPAMIDVNLGSVSIMVSNNYHGSAPGRPRAGEPVAGIAIRADKPYVLDFSNKPVVVFTEPVADRLIARGQEILIKAVLVDPKLDLMIRRLYDAGGATKETFKTPDGKEQTYTRRLSLDPKVTITRTNGEIVAEGVMPFG